MKRIGVVVGLVVLAVAGFAAPAHAAAQNRVWVEDGFLFYEYSPTAPATHLVVRTSGDTFVVTDSYGLYAGPGCTYPSQYGWIVHCTGISVDGGASIQTGPEDDFVDFLPSGAYAAITSNIITEDGDDTILGSDGGSKLLSGPGNDIIRGYGGVDIISAASGADQMYGGSGVDTVYYTHSSVGVVASLDGVAGNDGAPGEGDTIGSDVENISGSPFDDVLTGDSGSNELIGCGGSDQLDGLAGNDTLQGDGSGCGAIGADRLVGGAGVDMVRYDERTTRVVVDLTGTAASDGQSGERDSVGPDVENLMGGRGDDIVLGNASPNAITGGPGNDTIYGFDGDDTLRGGDGNDGLFGGNGADQLDGAGGTDSCDLGAGGLSTTACEP